MRVAVLSGGVGGARFVQGLVDVIEPREVTVPPDFQKALNKDAKARKFFEGLSYSRKQWFVLPIEGAKTEETRQRRIAKAVTMLHEGRSQ